MCQNLCNCIFHEVDTSQVAENGSCNNVALSYFIYVHSIFTGNFKKLETAMLLQLQKMGALGKKSDIQYLIKQNWWCIFYTVSCYLPSQQWFNMYAPTRLELDQESLCDGHSLPATSKSGSVLDIGKVFKGKTDKK